MFGNMVSSDGEELFTLPPDWGPTLYQLYETAYLINSQLPSNKGYNSIY